MYEYVCMYACLWYVCMYVCVFTQFCFTGKNTFGGRDKFGIGGAWDNINRAHMSSAELRPPGAGREPEWAVPTVQHLIFAS
uniref:Secreted protein n=1 Tax=Haemonchus contortus TaxID=6289 RepID=A0A7I4YV25_HAECO